MDPFHSKRLSSIVHLKKYWLIIAAFGLLWQFTQAHLLFVWKHWNGSNQIESNPIMCGCDSSENGIINFSPIFHILSVKNDCFFSPYGLCCMCYRCRLKKKKNTITVGLSLYTPYSKSSTMMCRVLLRMQCIFKVLTELQLPLFRGWLLDICEGE